MNSIESTFATVRLRQKVTKVPGSRAAGIAMAFKLIESAQNRWRAVNAPHLVALVRAGDTFKTVFWSNDLTSRKEVKSRSPKNVHPQVLTITPVGSPGRMAQRRTEVFHGSSLESDE